MKYEQNKAEVLSHLDVNSDLLDVMTRHGLIDISDWVKFKVRHINVISVLSTSKTLRHSTFKTLYVTTRYKLYTVRHNT